MAAQVWHAHCRLLHGGGYSDGMHIADCCTVVALRGVGDPLTQAVTWGCRAGGIGDDIAAWLLGCSDGMHIAGCTMVALRGVGDPRTQAATRGCRAVGIGGGSTT